MSERREIRKNEDAQRYELLIDGAVAGFADYRPGDQGSVVLPHTVTEVAFRGQGVAGDVVDFALRDIAASGRTVVPLCSYVAAYIDAHDEFADLVAR